ncbi:FG-GAP-like repeat-containing protein [Herbaspirillum huttiense]|uniref:FG-GAP-like repeat-containing protein n=1 Tax=Herbaspirillum huttiense TaxID=863372 RepID=UPI00287782B4|nr:FG-GAP-like repeat-containing protein [Herbaspirillum huttiense]
MSFTSMSRIPLSLLLLAASINVSAQMSNRGQVEVNATGAATYALPIQVPPGQGGMEPKLSFNYSSQSGTDLLGVGWSIGGLGGVSRCARSVAQDGVRGVVNYDWNDRYCLDGQRLIAVSGVDGGNGTEYRTEREAFAKVISYGSSGIGPTWFKVWTKSGQIMEYGNSSDSRIEAQGKSSIRVWALSGIKDTSGNLVSISYTKDGSNGDYRPAQITYGAKEGSAQTPLNSVRFTYEARPDIAIKYTAGSAFGPTQRLTKVSTFAGSSPRTEYVVGYAPAVAAQPSKVQTISECSPSSGSCLPSLNFESSYSAMSNLQGWAPRTSMEALNISACKLLTTADIDGDGVDDVICVYDYGGGKTMTLLRRSLGTGYTDWQGWSPMTVPADGFQPSLCSLLTLADVNGDGLPDLVCVYEYEEGRPMVMVQINNGDRFHGWQQWSPLTAPGSMYARQSCPLLTMADVNGDGRADIVCVYDYGDGRTTTTVQLSQGTSFAPWTPWNMQTAVGGFFAKSSCALLTLADVNGDGLPDVVCVYDYGQGQTNTFVQINQGNSFANWTAWSTQTGVGGFYAKNSCAALAIGDVNGDGLPDIVCVYDYGSGMTGTAVSINRGNSFAMWAIWGPTTAQGGFYAKNSCRMLKVADVNNDGKADVICVYDYGNAATVTTVQLSTGNSFTPWTSISPYLPSGFDASSCALLTLSDVNGDGAPDVLCLYDYKNGQAIFSAQMGTPVNYGHSRVYLKNWTSTSIFYTTTDNNGVYTKDTGSNAASYPRIDLHGPLNVVHFISTENGAGGSLRSEYRYGGLKLDLTSGRGLLGFRWMQIKQLESGLTSYTEYSQDWPYTGLPVLDKKMLANGGNGGVLSQTTTSYGCNDPSASSTTACTIAPGKRYFVYAKQSVESSWDYNGTALPVITTSSEYDNWGNATKVDVTTDDGFKKSTVNTYVNDSVNWYLGRLQRSSVTSTSP